jgi:hypothetical protein
MTDCVVSILVVLVLGISVVAETLGDAVIGWGGWLVVVDVVVDSVLSFMYWL